VLVLVSPANQSLSSWLINLSANTRKHSFAQSEMRRSAVFDRLVRWSCSNLVRDFRTLKIRHAGTVSNFRQLASLLPSNGWAMAASITAALYQQSRSNAALSVRILGIGHFLIVRDFSQFASLTLSYGSARTASLDAALFLLLEPLENCGSSSARCSAASASPSKSNRPTESAP
jgi:hypothetical protein